MTPKKGLSQNFLIDDNVVQKIVKIAEVKSGERILVIGPGPGALTQALLSVGAKVTAIEKDRQFAKALWRLQTPDTRLTVYAADILDFPIEDNAKIVANLPYHITTPILEKVFSRPFSSCTIMIQKEMAERLMAKPGTKEISSLTLFLQFYGTIVDSFIVSASSFYPKPKVDSAVIRIDSHKTPLENPEPFFKIIRRAYQQRRKMMTSSLKDLYPATLVQEALKKANMRVDARPEMLGLEDWLNFYRTICERSLSE